MLGTYPDCNLDQIGTSETERNSDASLIYIYSSHSFKNFFLSVVVIQMTLPFSETSKAPVERKWVSNMLLMKNAMRQEKIYKTDPSNVRNFLPCYYKKYADKAVFYVTVRIRTEDFLFRFGMHVYRKNHFFFQEIQTINAILTLFDEVRQIAVQTPQFKGQR